MINSTQPCHPEVFSPLNFTPPNTFPNPAMIDYIHSLNVTTISEKESFCLLLLLLLLLRRVVRPCSTASSTISPPSSPHVRRPCFGTVPPAALVASLTVEWPPTAARRLRASEPPFPSAAFFSSSHCGSRRGALLDVVLHRSRSSRINAPSSHALFIERQFPWTSTSNQLKNHPTFGSVLPDRQY